nr:sensor histidine kinase [Planctomycetota bacterium]
PPGAADRLSRPSPPAGKAPGPGLGLAIVRNLVTAHAGTIEVDHHPPEGGAAFELRLPALAGAQALGADEHPRAAEGAAGTASGEQDDPLPSPEQAPGERQSTRPGDGA